MSLTPTPAEIEVLLAAANVFDRLKWPGVATMCMNTILTGEPSPRPKDRYTAMATAIQKAHANRIACRASHKDGCRCVGCGVPA